MTTTNTQDTEPSKRTFARRTYQEIMRLITSRTILGVAAFLVLIIPLSVLAANVYRSGEDVQYTSRADYAPSLPSLDLLDPAQTPDHVLAVGGGSVDIVDGTLLRAETSPAGEHDGTVWVDRNGQIAKYLVRPGDTVGHIAELYGISAETIRSHNNISSRGYIVAGDVLEILPVDGVQYTTVSGDTVESLARAYNVSQEDIITFNNITGEVLEIGIPIIIPDAQLANAGEVQSVPSRAKVTAKGHDLGDYIFPCDCIVTQGYGNTKFARASSYYKSHWHGGVDFSSSRGTGTPVVAIDGGEVIKVNDHGWGGGYGLYVKVKHDTGVEALYAHNSSNTVSVGQRVEQGQIIGYMGTTGRVTGPHVHMEVTGDNPFYELFQGSYGY